LRRRKRSLRAWKRRLAVQLSLLLLVTNLVFLGLCFVLQYVNIRETLMDNYEKYTGLQNNIKASENTVLDIIFRKVRNVIETTPEPDDYEAIIEQMRQRIR